jgi:16S rRNA (uracil1498-N3)-methyltransferase
MTRRRWIADEYSDERAALTGAHASHLARTLRARVGQEFELACGDTVRRAVISNVADDCVEFTLGEEVSASPVVPVALLLAIIKFDRMEWAIEKCTELNLTTIIPVIARRTEKHLAQAADKRVERWRRIAREASEQSRRTAPPEITAPMKLQQALKTANTVEELQTGRSGGHGSALQSEGTQERAAKEPHRGGIEFNPGREPWVGAPDEPSPVGTAETRAEGQTFDATGGHCRIVLAETARDLTLADVLRAHDSLQSLTLAIGPEGGWTPEELRLFADSHWLAASLGETILRAETAAIASMAIARAEL